MGPVHGIGVTNNLLWVPRISTRLTIFVHLVSVKSGRNQNQNLMQLFTQRLYVYNNSKYGSR